MKNKILDAELTGDNNRLKLDGVAKYFGLGVIKLVNYDYDCDIDKIVLISVKNIFNIFMKMAY
jgi:hypothetical protein